LPSSIEKQGASGRRFNQVDIARGGHVVSEPNGVPCPAKQSLLLERHEFFGGVRGAGQPVRFLDWSIRTFN